MASIRRPALAAAALVAALTLTATACDPQDEAGGKPDSTADHSNSDLAKGLKERLRGLGVDLEKWKGGAWKDWDRDNWLREASDFINPIIDNLWDPERMHKAKDPANEVNPEALNEQGVTDPVPAPVTAKPVPTPYHENAAPVGKVFFDSPKGAMVCSATVVKDPKNPGKSNLVWTAGHCVHSGSDGGWYRNIAFVPSFNDTGVEPSQLSSTPREKIAPYGQWWADWASTSSQWISGGSNSGGEGAPYDFAVLHVQPENGGGKSLEETVGAALPVEFAAPAITELDTMGAWGYPAAPPYNGVKMHSCVDNPSRLSIKAGLPTMYRIGCTMTGGSSGGGWFAPQANGQPALVSNTSIGPASGNGWLAGPRLGSEAKAVYTAVSDKFAGN
ncbi:trypsin-like serine peptidase [Streptomyces sp. TP-A0874]|uniref:trypsin-like serine peptidase n=1 Tax=Streptomyces sp. TP-A0874 TaxID=549819 RepID=UPI000852CE40|nr:hypothetical protein [Streptomyces sp. TP-A0874]